MKHFIVLASTIALGLFIYSCVAGPEDSILQTLKEIWVQEAERGSAIQI